MNFDEYSIESLNWCSCLQGDGQATNCVGEYGVCLTPNHVADAMLLKIQTS